MWTDLKNLLRKSNVRTNIYALAVIKLMHYLKFLVLIICGRTRLNASKPGRPQRWNSRNSQRSKRSQWSNQRAGVNKVDTVRQSIRHLDAIRFARSRLSQCTFSWEGGAFSQVCGHVLGAELPTKIEFPQMSSSNSPWFTAISPTDSRRHKGNRERGWWFRCSDASGCRLHNIYYSYRRFCILKCYLIPDYSRRHLHLS